MVYVEMSRDEAHGGGDWAFPKCVFAPTRKSDGSRWSHWEKVMEVQKGDTILHLRGKTPNAHFVGYSLAVSDAYIIRERPPILDPRHSSTEFFRADLEDFTPFTAPFNLTTIFSNRRKELEEFFWSNRSKTKDRLSLFYVYQGKQLQCLNGGYFSDMSSELWLALFGTAMVTPDSPASAEVENVPTGSQLRNVLTRIGQGEFSRNTKENYDYRCCFPGCEIDDVRFLIGSHIARWADHEALRGDMENGLCLCSFHDKAFEIGLFTFDSLHRVCLTPAAKGKVAETLQLAEGQTLVGGRRRPSLPALREHWKRISFAPI